MEHAVVITMDSYVADKSPRHNGGRCAYDADSPLRDVYDVLIRCCLSFRTGSSSACGYGSRRAWIHRPRNVPTAPRRRARRLRRAARSLLKSTRLSPTPNDSVLERRVGAAALRPAPSTYKLQEATDARPDFWDVDEQLISAVDITARSTEAE